MAWQSTAARNPPSGATRGGGLGLGLRFWSGQKDPNNSAGFGLGQLGVGDWNFERTYGEPNLTPE